jgi:chromosome partitioning protein
MGRSATLAAVPPPERSASVITVLNLKGGVGKTHTTWLLASVCEERGMRCLLIDTDPQGNLSNSFLREREGVAGVERLLDPSQDADGLSLVQRTQFEHIDLLPSSPLIARFDVADQRSWEKADLHRSFLATVKAAERLYDLIIFDCPPRLSLTSFAALCASRFVIVPMEAADWGAQGVSQVTEAVEYVRSHYNAQLSILGYLVSRFKSRRLYQQTYLAGMREHFGKLVFDTTIDDLSAFERAVTDAVPIIRHSPRSSAARIARRFFDETLRRIAELAPGRESGVRPLDRSQGVAAAR